MPAHSLSLSACFPLMSTIDVVHPTIFHRGSLPTALRSRLSGDCAPAGVAIHASAAMRDSLTDMGVVAVMLSAPRRRRFFEHYVTTSASVAATLGYDGRSQPSLLRRPRNTSLRHTTPASRYEVKARVHSPMLSRSSPCGRPVAGRPTTARPCWR